MQYDFFIVSLDSLFVSIRILVSYWGVNGTLLWPAFYKMVTRIHLLYRISKGTEWVNKHEILVSIYTSLEYTVNIFKSLAFSNA